MSGIEGESAAQIWVAEAIQDEEERCAKFLAQFVVKTAED